LPSTEHSISRARSMAFSTTALRANENASSIAASRFATDFTFEMPTEDPRVAGLTKTGRPRPSTRSRTDSAVRSHTGSGTTSYGPTGRPAAENSTFCTALSMPTAEARTPAPTYGTPASSSIPWMVPSSPKGPCRMGNTTSISSRVPSSRTRARSPGSRDSEILDPSESRTAGRAPGAGRPEGSASRRCHRPRLSIPIETTS
jgi:hypothetical protein